MSAQTAKAGLYTVLAAVTELRELDGSGNVVNVLKYIPRTVHYQKLAYIRFRGASRSTSAQVTAMRYRFLVRLLVIYQDNEGAETLLDTLINKVPAAIDASPTLGGAIARGVATVTEIESEPPFLDMGGTLCRYADYEVEVVEKAGYGSGI